MADITKVKVFLGDGAGELELEVSYWATFLRGPDGNCAFCSGDFNSKNIIDYFDRNKWADTCPVCEGRPS